MKSSSNESVKIRYYLDWEEEYERGVTLITEAAARRYHEAGELYCAVLQGDESRVAIECELSAGTVEVFFLDADDSWTDIYLFTVADSGKMWLSERQHRHPAEGGHLSVSTETLPDGREFETSHLVISQDIWPLHKKTVSSQLTAAEFESLSEPIPQFGQYTSIARFNRSQRQGLVSRVLYQLALVRLALLRR